jgi:hypothetical protein
VKTIAMTKKIDITRNLLLDLKLTPYPYKQMGAPSFVVLGIA